MFRSMALCLLCSFALLCLPTQSHAQGQQGDVESNARTVVAPVASGIRVDRVAQGTPATRMKAADGKTYTLESGDVITHIDGVQMKKAAQFRAALGGGGAVVLTVVDRNGGGTYEFTARPQDGILGIYFTVVP